MSMRLSPLTFTPIGIVRDCCYSQRFSVPRQSGLVPSSRATLKLLDTQALRDSLLEIQGFSHLWVLFYFHDRGAQTEWRPRIRPPRLRGEHKVGVLASRSPHRPNPIGLSAVELIAVTVDAPGGPELLVGGIDLQEGTPILDIKPYIAYADSIPSARAGWAAGEWPELTVVFSPEAEQVLAQHAVTHPDLRQQFCETIASDPRPPYQIDRSVVYKTLIWNFDAHWTTRDPAIAVVEKIAVLTQEDFENLRSKQT